MRIQNKELSGAIVTLGCVLLSALLQTYVIQSMMQPMGLLSGGFTGLAILLDRIAGVAGFPFSVSAGILMLNIPLALLCYRGLSKRFTLYSSIQFISSSIFLQLFHFQPIFHDLLLQVLFGGFLYGSALSLHCGGMHQPVVRILLHCMFPTVWGNPYGAMCLLGIQSCFVYPVFCLAGCMPATPSFFNISQPERLKCSITVMNV